MINHIEIINWRTYEQFQVQFKPGITFIMGTNGKGKTSLLEAIAYALTGEPSTVLERGKLLRNPQKLATVHLSVTINEQQYRIERSQSRTRADKAKLIRLSDQKILASNHKQVTGQIEQLLNVSTDFLQRIVYMAEGDVYRFLKEASGKAIDRQIRQILGMNQMDEFWNALKLAGREINQKIKALQDLLIQLEQLKVKQKIHLESKLEQINSRRQNLLTQLNLLQERITRLKQEEQEFLDLKPLFEKIIQTLQLNSENWAKIQHLPMPTYYEQIKQQIQQVTETIQTNQMTQARFQGEQGAYQRILEVLQPYTDSNETLPCPVCQNLMTEPERETVIQNLKQKIKQLSIEAQQLNLQQLDLNKNQHNLHAQLADLDNLLNKITHHLNFQSLVSQLPFGKLLPERMQAYQKDREMITHLQQEAHSFEQMIAELEQETAQFLTLQRRLYDLGSNSPEEAREGLIKLEIRSLTLRAAEAATQETLGLQRNQHIQTIYQQLARLWSTFTDDNTWQVELDSEGMPKLENQAGYQLDLSQFSGGEKTVLLIILHTVIVHYFSKSHFILMDEPLSHLDPINRRSVMNFLSNLYRQGGFQQVIATTFEESLIRKYMSAEGVNVIYL
jgi:exonuclease SbcC